MGADEVKGLDVTSASHRETDETCATLVPPLPWGVQGSVLLFIVSLATPMERHTWKTETGFQFALSCAQGFRNFVAEELGWKGWLGDTFFWGDWQDVFECSLIIPDVLMLMVPGLFLLPARLRRFWPAGLATAAALHVVFYAWVLDLREKPNLLPCHLYWTWSFLLLAGSLWLWEFRASRAAARASTHGAEAA